MPKKKSIKKKSAKRIGYVCEDCGTEVHVDSYGIGFKKLYCCGLVMRRNRGR